MLSLIYTVKKEEKLNKWHTRQGEPREVLSKYTTYDQIKITQEETSDDQNVLQSIQEILDDHNSSCKTEAIWKLLQASRDTESVYYFDSKSKSCQIPVSDMPRKFYVKIHEFTDDMGCCGYGSYYQIVPSEVAFHRQELDFCGNHPIKKYVYENGSYIHKKDYYYQ